MATLDIMDIYAYPGGIVPPPTPPPTTETRLTLNLRTDRWAMVLTEDGFTIRVFDSKTLWREV